MCRCSIIRGKLEKNLLFQVKYLTSYSRKQGFIQALLLTPVFLKEDSVLVMHRYSRGGQGTSGGRNFGISFEVKLIFRLDRRKRHFNVNPILFVRPVIEISAKNRHLLLQHIRSPKHHSSYLILGIPKIKAYEKVFFVNFSSH